ncbi:HAD-IA family hydrolase [Pelagibacteraceae bacterium]|nr:HAD-IA family hydrolase [Pelagibacteraceae bacterium]
MINKAILFDLDGTLVETAPDLMSAHNHVMEKYGFEKKPLSDIRYLAGRGAATMLMRSANSRNTKMENKINEKTHKEMTTEFIDFYSKNICKGSVINPGVIDYLKWCKDQKIHLAVCTNKMEYLTIKLLKEIKLYDYFDFIAGADTFNYRKPNPQHITSILEILNIPIENSIMIGDSETDAEASKAAKVKFILVKGGYTEKKYNQIFHDHLVDSFKEIKDLSKKILNI